MVATGKNGMAIDVMCKKLYRTNTRPLITKRLPVNARQIE